MPSSDPSRNPKSKRDTPPHLTQNTISYIGWTLTLVIGSMIVVLAFMGIFFFPGNPYNAVVTYLVLPGFLCMGVTLIPLGALIEWRRRHNHLPEEYSRLPVINLNFRWQRRRVVIGAILLALFFAVSAVGGYKSYHFTESPTFCGMVCHAVMKPEYVSYQHSPHARVSCAECHIGEGADWYVKSKLSGVRQVWAVLADTYELPIKTPVQNLRPARETCEECHWPEKFSESIERVVWHFAPDEANTPMRINMLMQVGGGDPEAGLGEGIHWHINPRIEVRYWARDKQRLDIPWIEVRREGEEPRVYRSPDCPDELPEDARIRDMDCVDCHNRPSHIYKSPRTLIDFSLARGTLDTALPYLKRNAMHLFEQEYESTEEALGTIEKTMTEKYREFVQGPRGAEMTHANIEWLKTIYQRNFFPEQGVDWSVYPNHLGHFQFPGCTRCHNNEHRSEDGHTIENDCQLCHKFVDQVEGPEAYRAAKYEFQEFKHPRNLGGIWKGKYCVECHAVGMETTPTGTTGLRL